MNNVFVVKNLFDYETVIAPPHNLPPHLKTCYITDSISNCEKAEALGWDIVVNTQLYVGIEDKMQRRRIIAHINTFPHKVCPQLLDFDLVFVSDSNIVSMWDEYHDFVKGAEESNKALFVTSGYYSGERDCMLAEMRDSISGNSRWSYNHKEIEERTMKYLEIINFYKEVESSVVSAKYIGWNLHHKDYYFLSNIMEMEGQLHLQGNIILTFLASMYPNNIYNYYTKNYRGGQLNSHNYEA